MRPRATYADILECEFLLVYHGHFSLNDVEEMAAKERDWFLDRLVKEKKTEQEAIDRASRGK